MKQDILQQKYAGFRFPDCFFEFQDFVNELQHTHAININRSALQVSLADTFKIFDEQTDTSTFDPWATSRYPNDPPEFFTMLHGPSDGLHWGYYIDDENAPKIEVASYYHREGLSFTINGLNLHEAVRSHLEQCWHDNADYLKTYNDDVYKRQLDELNTMRDVLKKYYTADRGETGLQYLNKYHYTDDADVPLRYGIGIKLNGADYRTIPDADKFVEPGFTPTHDELMQYSQQAIALLNDGYPFAALKLGRDMWCYEQQYRAEAINVLTKAYQALNRPRSLYFLNRIASQTAT